MNVDFLEQAAGDGLNDIHQDDMQQALLLISQKLSKVLDAGVPEGHWYNSVTQEDYGSVVRVVVVGIQKLWFVWAKDQSGLVGRYEVGSIPVTGDNYTGMVDNDGNKVIETYCYACILPDHLDAGTVVMPVGRGNAKYVRAWNTSLRMLRLPSGTPAPLYAGIWNLTLTPDQDKQGRKYFSMKGGISFDSFVNKDMFTTAIQPARAIATQSIARVELKEPDADITSEPTAY